MHTTLCSLVHSSLQNKTANFQIAYLILIIEYLISNMNHQTTVWYVPSVNEYYNKYATLHIKYLTLHIAYFDSCHQWMNNEYASWYICYFAYWIFDIAYCKLNIGTFGILHIEKLNIAKTNHCDWSHQWMNMPHGAN